jgi:hypothetical protein
VPYFTKQQRKPPVLGHKGRAFYNFSLTYSLSGAKKLSETAQKPLEKTETPLTETFLWLSYGSDDAKLTLSGY